MQLGNCLLSLAGDAGNTVSKYAVTPAEIAVLQFIHGEDAVNEIEPTEEVERSSREERQRLLEVYGRNDSGRFVCPAVDALFPGAASRVFERFDELTLADAQYKALARVKSAPASIAKAVAEPEPEPEPKAPAKGKKGKGKKAAAPEPEPVADEPEPDDGIDDMPDKNLFK